MLGQLELGSGSEREHGARDGEVTGGYGAKNPFRMVRRHVQQFKSDGQE